MKKYLIRIAIIVMYPFYVLLWLVLKATISFLKLIIWPFRSFSNFFKTLLFFALLVYIYFIEYRFSILTKQYGGYEKFFCLDLTTYPKLRNSVVRIVGGYSEGSGFFVAPNQILTNFHVIDGEPSPKIIFPDGHFSTPTNITAYKDLDLALLTIEDKYPNFIYEYLTPLVLADTEPVIAVGYPMGTDIKGEATLIKGHFISFRDDEGEPRGYVQTSISLVRGMSGGPLVDQCGKLVGVNTMGVAGTSFFVSTESIMRSWSNFTDQDITKIEIDTSTPEGTVTAFYTYLKARKMEEGFKLLSSKYLEKTNLEEWTSRFSDILDVEILKAERISEESTIVKVKFATKNWVDEDAVYHYYEGTWETVFEDGVYKLNKSKIIEVEDPSWEWFYE